MAGNVSRWQHTFRLIAATIGVKCDLTSFSDSWVWDQEVHCDGNWMYYST